MINHISIFQPSAIDNALSTMQIIHKLINQMNIIIDEVNSIDSKANEYTDEQIKVLNDKIENELIELEKTLKEYSDTLNNNLKLYVDSSDKQIYDLIKIEISLLKNEMKKMENTLKLYSDVGDSKLLIYIDNIYKELYDLIMNGNDIIYSPVDGFLKSTKDVIQDLTHVLQIKNGIDWNTFESICSGENVDMTGFVKPNSKYNIWLRYEQPQYANTDYLDINGLYIVCYHAISNILIDGQPYTDFTGGGVLFPLSIFNSYEKTIIITDLNNNVTTLSVRNTDYTSSSVTWDSLENKLNTSPNNRYYTWNALSFYTVEFANYNLMGTDGKMKSVLLENMYTTEYNKKFFGGN